MRAPILIIAAMTFAGCGRADSSALLLHKGKAERVNGCHVMLDFAPAFDDVRRTMLRVACGAPESAIHEKQWWGDRPEPLGLTADVGDCVLLDSTYYCLEDVKNGEWASFRATYKQHRSMIERIR